MLSSARNVYVPFYWLLNVISVAFLVCANIKLVSIVIFHSIIHKQKLLYIKKNLHGLSPRANYTDRVAAACRRSDCQLVRIEDATWSV
jgi:hypothetical protein